MFHSYKIKQQKSCSGIISWNDDKYKNIVYTVDVVNDNNDDPIDHLLNNTFINYKKLHNVINVQESQLYKEFIESESKATFYNATNDNIRHFIKHYKYPKDYPSDKIKLFDENVQQIICPVTHDTYSKRDLFINDPYFNDILTNGKNNKISKYLDSIDGSELYNIDTDFIILPDLLKYPIIHKDIEIYNQIKLKKDYVSLFDFLSKLTFSLFIKGDPNNYKYTNIYEIKREDLLVLLNKIKIKIIKFYELLSDGTIPNLDNYIQSYIYPDANVECIMIKFFLFDIYKGYKYISFVDYFKNLSIKFIINALETGQDITYYKRFDISEQNNINCKTNYLYNRYHHTGSGKKISLKDYLIQNTSWKNKDTIVKIVNKQYQNSNTKGYCSLFLLVSVIINNKETVYEVTFKTITYSSLSNSDSSPELLNFKQQFYNKLKKIIDNPTNGKIEYNNEYKLIEYYDYLPTNFEIKIKPVKSPISKIRLYFTETAEDYWNSTVKTIKEQTKLDSQIILYMLYQNSKNTEIGQTIQTYFNRIPYLSKLLSGDILMSQNFLVKEKTYYTGIEDKYFYNLWYFPKFIVSDKNRFIQLLEEIIFDCTKLQANDELIDKHMRENYQDILAICTNYKILYNDSQYIHNLKHLTEDNKKEIDQLLIKFYNQMGYKDFKDNEIYMYPYILFCNYPGSPSYNNFHIQIYSFKNMNSKTKFDIRNYNYIDPNVSRAISWELVRMYDYKKLDSILSYDIEYDKSTKEFNKKAFEELLKKAGRFLLASKIPSDDTLKNIISL